MNLRLLFLVFLAFSFTATQRGAAQGWQWAYKAGGTGNESAATMATDASGYIYVAGYFSSASITFGGFPITNTANGYTDIFLTKYDPSGNVVWAVSAGGIDNDYASSLAIDPWGNIYMAGYYYSTSIAFGAITLTNDSVGTSDMYVTKYNASGNVIWAKNAGGTYDDHLNAVKSDAAGNVIVTGNFESPHLIFGTDTVKNSIVTADEVVTIKYDSSGNFLWADGAAGGDNYAYAVTTDAADNIYVAGSFSSGNISFSDSILTNSSGGTSDLFLVKYNASGVVQWARKAIGKGNDDVATSIGTGTNDEIYIAGNFSSDTLFFNTTALVNAGGYDMFVAKYSPAGNVMWAKSSGGAASDYAHSLAVDDSSYVVVLGNFGSPSMHFGATTITNDSAGTSDLFLAKYDSSGNALWALTTGGPGSNANAVAASSPGNIYVAGNFSDSLFSLGPDTLLNFTNTNTYDMFIGKYHQSQLSVQQTNIMTQGISVFPNPTTGAINVVFNIPGYSSIGVYDCLGKMACQKMLPGNEKTVSISTDNLADGIYFLRATNNGSVESATFVIRR